MGRIEAGRGPAWRPGRFPREGGIFHCKAWLGPGKEAGTESRLRGQAKEKRQRREDLSVEKTFDLKPEATQTAEFCMSIPVFLPGDSQGWRSLVGCRLRGRTETDTTEAT